MIDITPIVQGVDLSTQPSASVGSQQNAVAQVISGLIDVPEQRALNNQGAPELEVRQCSIAWCANA